MVLTISKIVIVFKSYGRRTTVTITTCVTGTKKKTVNNLKKYIKILIFLIDLLSLFNETCDSNDECISNSQCLNGQCLCSANLRWDSTQCSKFEIFIKNNKVKLCQFVNLSPIKSFAINFQ